MLDITPQPPYVSTTPIAQLEPWEEDLRAFLRGCKPPVEGSLKKEETSADYPQLCEPGVEDDLEKKARRFAERLNSVRRYIGFLYSVLQPYVQALDNRRLPQEKKTRYLRYLRRLCGTFGILPSSFVLAPKSIKRAAAPFAYGGFSDVYSATFEGRSVAVKVLRIPIQMDPKKVHRVGFYFRDFKVTVLTGH